MDAYLNDRTPSIKPEFPEFVSSRALTRCRRQSAAKRALLGYRMSRGEVVPSDLSLTQVCRLTGASPVYVRAIARMSDAQRELVKSDDLKIGAFIRRKTDAQLDRLVMTVGPNRILEALDRYTKPQFAFAAE